MSVHEPSYQEIIDESSAMIRDLNYQIAAAPPHAGTDYLRRLVRYQQGLLENLHWMRHAYAPDPSQPLR